VTPFLSQKFVLFTFLELPPIGLGVYYIKLGCSNDKCMSSIFCECRDFHENNSYRLLKWRSDIQHDDTQHNDIFLPTSMPLFSSMRGAMAFSILTLSKKTLSLNFGIYHNIFMLCSMS
jgi:hypothetical protein